MFFYSIERLMLTSSQVNDPQGRSAMDNHHDINPQDIAGRYVAVWNETDPAARRKGIVDLWDPDGAHCVRTLEAHGYDALEKRITGSHDRNVRDRGHHFRAVQNAQTVRNVVTFNWEMTAADDGKVLASGLEFLVLDEQGRIVADYQFMVA